MKKTHILLALCCILKFSIGQQNFKYTPTSNVSIDASSLNPVGIENAVNKLEKPFTDKEIAFLKSNLDSCQAMIDRNIAKLKNECYNLMQNKSKLEQLRDIEQLAKDIEEKENKIQVLKQDALNQLLGIYYQGVYAAVLDCSWKDEKDPLAERTREGTKYYAQRQLTDSIKELIKSVEGTKTITDFLLENIKGKIAIEEELISSKIDGQTKYILISKATFYPFEEGEELKKDRKVDVTNLIPLFDVSKKLKEYKVTDEDMQEYKDIIDIKINAAKEENYNTTKTAQNIIIKKRDMYTVLYSDLVEFKDHMLNREEHVERIIKGNTEVDFNKKTFENSIDEATKYFQKKIESKIDSMISEKSKELIPSKYNVNVALTNSPVSSISESVFSMAQQLEKLNYVINDFSDFTTENIVREIDKIWVYPTAGNNDNFLMTVVASFKIRRNVSSTSYPGMVKDGNGQTFEYYRDPVTERDYSHLKGGMFQMGSNDGQIDEKPVHEVKLNDFYIGKSEVTNKEFCAFLNNEGNKMEYDAWWLDISDEDCKIYKKEGTYYVKEGFEEYPVVEVTWFGANAFCKWLSQETGRIYRLPTEAEWEYAAQGGLLSKNFKYSGSNVPEECAWYNKNSGGKAQRVCQKTPNEIGAYDMSGNVWEWCSDLYVSNYYKTSPSVDPKGAEKGYNRSIRGGAWFYDESYLRIANRSSFSPDFSSVYIGFRIVMQK